MLSANGSRMSSPRSPTSPGKPIWASAHLRDIDVVGLRRTASEIALTTGVCARVFQQWRLSLLACEDSAFEELLIKYNEKQQRRAERLASEFENRTNQCNYFIKKYCGATVKNCCRELLMRMFLRGDANHVHYVFYSWCQLVARARLLHKSSVCLVKSCEAWIGNVEQKLLQNCVTAWVGEKKSMAAKTERIKLAARYFVSSVRMIRGSVLRQWQKVCLQSRSFNKRGCAMAKIYMMLSTADDNLKLALTYSAWRELAFASRVESLQLERSSAEEEMRHIKKYRQALEANWSEQRHRAVYEWLLGQQVATAKLSLQSWMMYTHAKLMVRQCAMTGQAFSNDSQFSLAPYFFGWRREATASLERGLHEAELKSVDSFLRNYAEDLGRRQQGEIDQWMQEMGRLKLRTVLVCESIFAKWMAGDEAGLVLTVWKRWADENRKWISHKKQRLAVQYAMAGVLQESSRQCLQLVLNQWIELCNLERRTRSNAAKAKEAEAAETALLEKMQVALEDATKRARMDWMMSMWKASEKNFLGSWFVMWTDALKVIQQSENRSLVVKNSINRLLLGDARGMLVTVHHEWFGYCQKKSARRVAKGKHRAQMLNVIVKFSGCNLGVFWRVWLESWRQIRDSRTRTAQNLASKTAKNCTANMMLKSAACLASKEAAVALKVSLMAWRRVCIRSSWAAENTRVTKASVARALMGEVKMKDSNRLTRSFVGWWRVAKGAQQVADRLFRIQEEHMEKVKRLEEHQRHVEHQLELALRRVEDNITEAVQTELTTKAKLADMMSMFTKSDYFGAAPVMEPIAGGMREPESVVEPVAEASSPPTRSLSPASAPYLKREMSGMSCRTVSARSRSPSSPVTERFSLPRPRPHSCGHNYTSGSDSPRRLSSNGVRHLQHPVSAQAPSWLPPNAIREPISTLPTARPAPAMGSTMPHLSDIVEARMRLANRSVQ